MSVCTKCQSTGWFKGFGHCDCPAGVALYEADLADLTANEGPDPGPSHEYTLYGSFGEPPSKEWF